MSEEKQNKIIYTRADLKAKGIEKSNVTLLRWEDDGHFPKRVYAGGTTVAWLADEVDAWFGTLSATRAVRKHHQPRR